MPHRDKADALFSRPAAKPATAYDKTSAAAREITEAEAALRAEKTANLKAARLARDKGEDAHGAAPQSDIRTS
ncbi:hypothetical protein [Celeribacter litoreus]|uniref:hypothetical protein n=1 Tax=Celeribacter litoreus TaxID=2876714 RepID=UPI001CCACB71|nr:hypothetical protein [Celeribacter litoreus]MCA0045341.1 hypothetical protein [Celeribacter litoreus]